MSEQQDLTFESLAWPIRFLFAAIQLSVENHDGKVLFNFGLWKGGTPMVRVSLPDGIFTFSVGDARYVADVGERSLGKLSGPEQEAIADFIMGIRHAADLADAEANSAPTP